MPDDSKLFDIETKTKKLADKIREVIPNPNTNYAESLLPKNTLKIINKNLILK